MSVLTPDVCEQIDQWTAKFPTEQKRSALLAALSIAQDAHQGWLSSLEIEAVADYLAIPHVAAYEVATFYSMYELAPIGRHKISICTNLSCQLRGCQTIVDHLEQRCGIKLGESNDRYTLRAVECMGACIHAPMVEVGKRYYENLTPAKVDELLATLDNS